MGVIRHFPTDIRIGFGDLRYLNRQWDSFIDYKLAALEAIQQQAEQETAAAGAVDFSHRPDLRQPGPFAVSAQTLSLVDSDRPLDISYTLDELARLSAAGAPYQGRLDLGRVGVIGHSLGGYTALAIAGAPVNTPLLQQACVPDRPFVANLSVYLQCRAAPLPPSDISLRDSRIGAAIALNPITSVVQGPSGLGQIDIPLMLVASSVDLLATPVQEQIHPFTWLTTETKYLVTMAPAGHGSSVQASPVSYSPYAGLAPNTSLGSEYSRALATAFMQVHAAGDDSYLPFLSAAYASYLSADPIALNLVRSLTAGQLEAAYGAPSPLPIRPGAQ